MRRDSSGKGNARALFTIFRQFFKQKNGKFSNKKSRFVHPLDPPHRLRRSCAYKVVTVKPFRIISHFKYYAGLIVLHAHLQNDVQSSYTYTMYQNPLIMGGLGVAPVDKPTDGQTDRQTYDIIPINPLTL